MQDHTQSQASRRPSHAAVTLGILALLGSALMGCGELQRPHDDGTPEGDPSPGDMAEMGDAMSPGDAMNPGDAAEPGDTMSPGDSDPGTPPVDTTGGTVEHPEGEVILDFPPGAVTEPTEVTIDAATLEPATEAVIMLAAFEFGPDGITFDVPVEVVMAYDPWALPDGISEEALQIFKVIDNAWEPLPGGSIVDPFTQTVTGYLNGFSKYGVGTDLTPALAGIDTLAENTGQPGAVVRGHTAVIVGIATIVNDTSTSDITSVTLTETSGYTADGNLLNAEVWLSSDATLETGVDNQLGITAGFTSDSVTFTETFQATTTTQYLIARLDIAGGATLTASGFEISMDFATVDTKVGAPLAFTGATRVDGPTGRVSETSAGGQATGGDSVTPALSNTGRHVAFASSATNLVTDTNSQQDVFVHDRDTDADASFDEVGSVSTVRVSVTTAGAEATGGDSYAPDISDNGRYVVFTSDATNLVGSDTNTARDVFLHDRDTDNDSIFDEPSFISTTRVSVDGGGGQGGAESYDGKISGDGTQVVFVSSAANLGADTNGVPDVYVRNLTAGTTDRVSIDSLGAQATGPSFAPSISGTGRWVAFMSGATDRIASDTNFTSDIFVHDRDSNADGTFNDPGPTVRVSVASDGSAADGPSDIPMISSDGRYVVFVSWATNLVAGDTNGLADIFLHDRDTDNDTVFDEAGSISTVRISVSDGEAQANAGSFYFSISNNAQVVTFWSGATNLVAGDTNGVTDIFLRDVGAGTTVRVSVAGDGTQGDAASTAPSVSGDGLWAAFESSATNLLGAGVDTNGNGDVFTYAP